MVNTDIMLVRLWQHNIDLWHYRQGQSTTSSVTMPTISFVQLLVVPELQKKFHLSLCGIYLKNNKLIRYNKSHG